METRKWTVYIHKSPSGKFYVGITGQEVERRWKNGEGYKTNTYFYKAINKYGWDNFKHIIFRENLTAKEAKSIEIKMIAILRSNNKKYGYNITAGGDGSYGMIKSKETREKISKSLTGRKNPPPSKETREKISETKKGKKNPMYKHSSIVYQYDLDGNLLKSYQGTGEAERETGINKAGIVRCCNGKYKQSGGYIWRYERYANSTNKLNKVNRGNLVPVCQFDLDGNYINTYPSAMETQRQTATNSSKINMCCRGKRNKAGGYIWRYEKDINIEQVS